MKQSKSRRSLNGWNEEHTNQEVESQRESVAINRNRMVEIKRSKSRISLNGLVVEHTNRETENQRESVAIHQNGMLEMKCNQKGRFKSRIRLNGLIMKHMNQEAESQRESVVRDQNGMVELKRNDRKKTTGGARRQNYRRLNCNKAIAMVVKILIWLVNVGMFGNRFVVKNLISKRFKCQRIQIKMVDF